ncbi:MAG: SUMF1/EgtB/PvdO family nonheme iron enzyme [Chloroflexota bacterium]
MPQSSHPKSNPHKRILYAILAVLLVSLACTIPFLSTPTAPVAITPTNTPEPPPAIPVPALSLAGPGIGTTMRWFDGSLLVYIPPGEFVMGSDEDDFEDNPKHNIYLDGFWITRYEVTNRMYALCVDAGECTPPYIEPDTPYYRDPSQVDEPVVGVTWGQAAQYCQWIQGRLPTEAEWEKAARGPEENIYPWGDGDPNHSLLNFDDYLGETSHVLSYPEGMSFYEVLDMAGNVFEWVFDWYDPDFYPISPYENPIGPEEGIVRSVRGSSFASLPEQIPSALRSYLDPLGHNNELGFRCIVTYPAQLPPPLCQWTSYQPGSGPPCQPPAFDVFVTQPGRTEQPVDCDPLGFELTNTFCQGDYQYINLNLNQPVTNVENFMVSANGAPLSCYPVTGAPNGLSCTGRIPSNTNVDITVCGNACEENPTGGLYPRCPDGWYFDRGTQACVPIPNQRECPQGYYYDPNRHTCLPSPGGSRYPQCPEGEYYDPGQQTCVRIPGGNECPQGFIYDQNRQTCYPCYEGQYFGGAPITDTLPLPPDTAGMTTVVTPTLTLTDTSTTPPTVTVGGPAFTQTLPICQPGYAYNDFTGHCEYVPQTGPTGEGECPPTYATAPDYDCLPVPNELGECPVGHYFDMGVQACVPIGGPTPCIYGVAYLPDQILACFSDCLVGYRFDPELQCCFPENMDGYPCLPGTYYNPNMRACTPDYDFQVYPDCPEGFYYNPNYRTCFPRDGTPECPEGQYYDSRQELCNPIPSDGECPEGYYFHENYQTCLPIPNGDQNPECPPDYYYDTQRQTCLPIPDGDEGPQCPEGFYYDENRQNCFPIPGGNQQPQCPEGYYYDENRQTCLPLPSGEQTPQCPEGYYYDPYLDACVYRGDVSPDCPEGYYYDPWWQTCIPGTGYPSRECVTITVYIPSCTIPTLTPKPTEAVLDCSQFTDPQSCFTHPECEWVQQPAGEYCKNK